MGDSAHAFMRKRLKNNHHAVAATSPDKSAPNMTNKPAANSPTTSDSMQQPFVAATTTSFNNKHTKNSTTSRKLPVPSPLPSVSFASLGGVDKTLIEICRLLRPIFQPEAYNLLSIKPPRGLLLHGPPGTGKTLLAQAIVGQLALAFPSLFYIQLSAPEIISGISGQSEQKLRDVFNGAAAAASSTPSVIFIDEIDAIAAPREDASKDMEKRIVSQLLSCMDSINSNSSVLVLGATNRLSSLDPALRRAGRFDHEIACGIPNHEARVKILRLLTKDYDLPSQCVACCEQLADWTPGYVGADLKAFVREASCRAVDRIFQSFSPTTTTTTPSTTTTLTEALSWLRPLTDDEKDSIKICLEKLTSSDNNGGGENACTSRKNFKLPMQLDDFQHALRIVQPAAKREGFATVPDVSWSDIGALDHVRHQLKLALVMPLRHRAAFERLGLDISLGILLCGPPGCGKTLLAKAVANETGLNFISVKGPELLNMYVGESERGVRQVFERARTSAPCVIFFDELDALVPRRTASSDSSVTSRVVNQLLVEMDGLMSRSEVFVLAATNRPDILDPALLRPGRFDKQIHVSFPDARGIVSILQAITRQKTKPPIDAEVDFDAVALDVRLSGFTGADVAALVRAASTAALEEVFGYAAAAVAANDVAEADLSTKNAADAAEVLKDSLSSIVVKQRHFETAMQQAKPSVSGSERSRYELMRLKQE